MKMIVLDIVGASLINYTFLIHICITCTSRAFPSRINYFNPLLLDSISPQRTNRYAGVTVKSTAYNTYASFNLYKTNASCNFDALCSRKIIGKKIEIKETRLT